MDSNFSSLPAVLIEVEALDPDALAPLAQQAIDEIEAEAASENTDASYRAALRYWAAWFAARYRRPLQLPLSPEVVKQFIVDHAQRASRDGMRHELPAEIDRVLVERGYKGKLGPMALSTLNHRISVLSSLHARHPNMFNPCKDPAVRELLKRTRTAYNNRNQMPRGKAALTREPLEALLETCDQSLQGLRDRALLLVAWASGGRRRSEIVQLTVEDLSRVGSDQLVFELSRSKTNRSGAYREENLKPVVGRAARALQTWLEAAGISSGPLFRQIGKGGRVGAALSAAAVREIVKKRCLLAGLPGDYSAHSLRSGFVTEAARQQIPLGETMKLTGHRTVPSVMRYYRSGMVTHSPAARLLDEPDGKQG